MGTAALPAILRLLAALLLVPSAPLFGQDPAPAPPPTDVDAPAIDPAPAVDSVSGDRDPTPPGLAPQATDTPPPVLDLVDELLWTAGALRDVLTERDFPTVLVLASLNRVLEDSDGEILDRLGPVLTALAIRPGAPSRLGQCRAAPDPVDGALCAVETLMPLAPAPFGREMAEEGARLVSLYLRPGEPSFPGPRSLLSAAGERGAGEVAHLLDPFQRFTEETLEDALRLRADGRERVQGFTDAFDQVLAGAVGFSPRAGADEILARVPDLGSLLEAHPILASLEATSASAQGVLREYQGFLGGLSGSIGQVLAGASGAEGFATAFLDEAESRAVRAFDSGSHRAFVYLAARSASITGLEAAVSDRIRAIGNASVHLEGGTARFTQNLAVMGREMAMAALSGNVLTMAVTLTSFFDATPGALGSGAATEVRALREGVETLRTELNLRLDEVDVRLDEVLAVVDTRFGRLEQLVASSSQSVQLEIRSLHQGMLALGERLEHMEENLHSYIQAGFDRDYSRTLIRCLEHRERYLPPFDQMEFAVFSECLADFRVRAVQDARDALLVDHTTPVDDQSLTLALQDPSLHNLARRLPLLGRAAEQRFGYPGMRRERALANLVEWGVAAQAYLTLLQDWPEHARAVAPGDLEAIRTAGMDLQTSLQAVTVDPTTGSRGTLLDRVLDYYGERVAQLTADADVLARRHQQAELLRVRPESLLNRIEPLDAGAPVLEVPAAIEARIPQEVRTAAVLALGEATLVYRLQHEDRVERQDVRRRFVLFGRRHDRITHTRTHVEVELRFGSLGSVAVYRASGPYVLSRVEEMAGDFTSDRVVSAREVIPDPTRHFVTEVWPGLVGEGGEDRWDATPPRPLALQTMENAIEAELRRHASVALNGVFSTVCEETPSGAALSGADLESALRIRGALDGMTAARSLLEAYLSLALPYSSENDDALREALYGPDGILNRYGLCRVVEQGDSPLRLVWLEEEPHRRATTLSAVLKDALDRDAQVPETLPLVTSTLEQLDAAIRVQRLRTMVARADL